MSATFSAEPDRTTPNLARLHLIDTYSDAGISLSSTTSTGPASINLTAIDGLPRATTIELRIDNTLTSGPATFAGQSIFFRTRAPTWTGSSGALTNGAGAEGIEVAYDNSGLSHVMWSIGDTVYVSEGGQSGTLLNYDHSTPAAEVSIDAAGAGKAVAAWVEGPTGRNVRASIFNGSWSSSLPIENFSENAASPDIAVDPSGNARVVWQQQIDGGVYVASASLSAGQWQAAEQISFQSGINQPHVATDDQGNAIVGWIENGAVKVRTGPLVGVLGADVTLAAATESANTLQVAMSGTGFPVVVWSGNSGITIATRPATAWLTFTVPVGSTPFVGIDELGLATVTYQSSGNWVIRGSGTTWTAPHQLDSGGSASPRPALIGVSGPVAVAVWIESSVVSMSSPYVVMSSTFAFGAWSTAVKIGGSRANFPMCMAMGPRRDGLAVWSEQPTSGAPRFNFKNLN